MAKMDKQRLQAILRDEVRKANGAVGGELSQNRLTALKYYNGEPFGNEVEGRSKVVSTDVRDTVESLMPEFVEIFGGGDKVVEFEPNGQEDVEAAEQATDYVNYLWMRDIDGFGMTHDLIKDALLQKTGYGKIWWDTKEKKKREVLTGLTTMQLTELDTDESVEIIEHEEHRVTDPAMMLNPEIAQMIPDGLLHDVTIIRTDKSGKINAACIPPEEFLRSKGATDLADCRFLCHRYKRTVSDLIEDGYKRDVVEDLVGSDDSSWLEERQARDSEDISWPDSDDAMDPSMREVLVYECYIKVDYNGDGVAEWRNVCAGGPGLEILHNEEVEDHPFVTLSAIRLSHNFDGLSVFDLVSDIQMVKSTIWRQLLDNMYQVNNGRTAISGKVNLDDYLANRVGGAVRVDTEGREALGNHIHPIVTQPILQHGMPLLQFADEVKEKRSGSTAYNQGLDSDSLNKTATGIERILGQAQKRMLLMARVMAETGFKQIFRKILKLVVSHQDKSRMIRLRNDWVPMDPRTWNADMDCTTNVGLGYGSKDQQVMFMRMLLEIQAQIVQFQGSPNGPLVDLEKVHSTLEKLTSAMGIKNTDAHFNPPPKQGGYEMPAPPPNPEAEKAKMQMEVEQAKLQLQAQSEAQKIEAEKQRLLFDAAKADKEMEQDEREALRKFEIERMKLDLDFQIKAQTAQMQAESERANFEATQKDADFNRQMQMIEAQNDPEQGDKILAVEKLRQQLAGEKDIAAQSLEEARMMAEQAVQAVQIAAQQAVQAIAMAAQPKVERKVIEIVPNSIRRNAAGDIVGAETVTRAA